MCPLLTVYIFLAVNIVSKHGLSIELSHPRFIKMDLVKNSTVLVNVEEVLDDIIVVSYTCSSGVFQGALLNSVKK